MFGISLLIRFSPPSVEPLGHSLGMDERGKVRLSMKVVDQDTGEDITES